jgi:hypothetical protein
VDREHPNSIVKFGSMDSEGLKDDLKNESGKTSLRIIKTKNKSTWDLSLEYTKAGMNYLGQDLTLRFEPQLPFVYLPTTEF